MAAGLEPQRAAAPAAGAQTWRFLIVALIAALLLFPSIRRQGLAGYDDSYFAHEGKEMVRSGDWWNVRFNGEFILAQGPLFPWLEALSFKLFGVNDNAAKVPGVVLGFATIVLMYPLALELTADSWLALLSVLVLASTQFFLKNASHAMSDVPFTFFFALAIFFYVKGLKNSLYLVLMGLPVGITVLTRSVVGLIALGIIFAHLLVTKRFRLLRSPALLSGVGLALALPTIWYISQYQIHGAAFFGSHLEFLNSKFHPENAPGRWVTVFNYPLMLLKYYWPWLPFLIAGIVMEARTARRARNETSILLILWVVLVLVPFSVAQTRYPRYIMAVFPAFTILSAIGVNYWLPVGRRKMFFAAACVIGVLAVCLSLAFPPKERAGDIVRLAPIVEANSTPDQRILIYTYEDQRADFQYQLLWYSNRYTQVAENLDDLEARVRKGAATVIVDKQSYRKILPALQGRNPSVVGESENLICFTVS